MPESGSGLAFQRIHDGPRPALHGLRWPPAVARIGCRVSDRLSRRSEAIHRRAWRAHRSSRQVCIATLDMASMQTEAIYGPIFQVEHRSQVVEKLQIVRIIREQRSVHTHRSRQGTWTKQLRKSRALSAQPEIMRSINSSKPRIPGGLQRAPATTMALPNVVLPLRTA